MATKKTVDFTATDRDRVASFIGAASEKDTKDTKGTKDTKATSNTKKTTNTKATTKTTSTTTTKTRHYNRLDPREEAPEEYRFTARMPGEYGRFLNELAYQRRSTITAELQRLVQEEMEKRPEILASLDELNN